MGRIVVLLLIDVSLFNDLLAFVVIVAQGPTEFVDNSGCNLD